MVLSPGCTQEEYDGLFHANELICSEAVLKNIVYQTDRPVPPKSWFVLLIKHLLICFCDFISQKMKNDQPVLWRNLFMYSYKSNAGFVLNEHKQKKI